MAERAKMSECLLHCHMVIEDNVGYVFSFAVGRDCHHRNRDFDVARRGVEQQKAIHGPFDKHARILLDQFAFPVVAGGEVKIVRAGQLLDDAIHDTRKVALAQVGRQNAHAHRPALAKGTGEVVGAIVEPLGRFGDPVAGLLGDGLGGWRVIQDERDGGLGELQMLGEHPEVDMSRWRRTLSLCHVGVVTRFT